VDVATGSVVASTAKGVTDAVGQEPLAGQEITMWEFADLIRSP